MSFRLIGKKIVGWGREKDDSVIIRLEGGIVVRLFSPMPIEREIKILESS